MNENDINVQLNDINPEIFDNISELALNDFHNNIINPKNINEIIKICEEHNMENIVEHIVKYAAIGKYVLKEYNDHIKLPKFMIEQYVNRQVSVSLLEYDCVHWIADICTKNSYNTTYLMPVLIEFGRDDLMELLIDLGFKWKSEITNLCGKYGRMKWLKYVFENELPYGHHLISCCSINGHYECLKYVHQQGCKIGKRVITNAVKNNHIKCVIYACMVNKSLLHDALKQCVIYDNIEYVALLLKNGAKIPNECFELFLKHNSIKCFKYLYENNYVNIENVNPELLLNCNIDIIKYLENINYQFPANICDLMCQCYYSKNKTIDEGFMFLISKGYVIKLRLVINVSIIANIDCVQYLQSIGSYYSQDTLNSLIKNDSSKCFEYLYNNGSEESMIRHNKIKYIVLTHDAIKCLKILQLNDIDNFTNENIDVVIKNDSIECFKYFHELNYDFSSIDIDETIYYTKIGKYMCENKCIISPLLLKCAMKYGIFDYVYLVIKDGHIPDTHMFPTCNIYYYLQKLDLTKFSTEQMYPIMFIVGHCKNNDAVNYLYDQGYIYDKENDEIIKMSKSSNKYRKSFDYLCKNTKLLDDEK